MTFESQEKREEKRESRGRERNEEKREVDVFMLAFSSVDQQPFTYT